MDTRTNHRSIEGELAAERYNDDVARRRERGRRVANALLGAGLVGVVFLAAAALLGCQGARIDGTPWGQVELLGADPVANPCDTCTPPR